MVGSAPYCEACGYQYWSPPGSPKQRRRWKDVAAAIAVGLCVAIFKYVVFG